MARFETDFNHIVAYEIQKKIMFLRCTDRYKNRTIAMLVNHGSCIASLQKRE